ncbi:MAG: hypothetical protein ACFFCM_01260 [Promethearchaeota archaeon]
MSSKIMCDICDNPIEDYNYYFCETCKKGFHFKCVRGEKKMFPGKPGHRECKYCNNIMIDEEDRAKAVKKEEKEREKLLKKEEEEKARLIKEKEEEETRLLKEEEKIQEELMQEEMEKLDRISDRKKMGGLMDAVKKKMKKSIRSGIEGILEIEDYKDEWTLIHGKPPILDDEYLYFHQIDEALNQHPNFLHFQIKHYLEELDYNIEHDIKPIPTEFDVGEAVIKIFNYLGYLSAFIECKREKTKGYTKIYLKEEGICHYSSKFAPPFVKGNIRIEFAGIVQNMNEEELQKDIEKLNGKIIEFLNKNIPF